MKTDQSNTSTDQNSGQGQEYGSFRIQPLQDGSNDKGLFLANSQGNGGIRIEHRDDGVHLDFYSGSDKSKPVQSMITSYESLQWQGQGFGNTGDRNSSSR